MVDEAACPIGPTTRSLLDTPAEERFDRLTRLARRCFSVPVSLLTVLTPDRQWLKAAQGTLVVESPVEVSFCVYALRSGKPLVLPDLAADERFASNPLVIHPPHVRFYAGVPLRSPEGSQVGTLCLLDVQPREFGREEMAALQDLAACAETELRFTHWSESEQEIMQEAGSSRRSLLDDDSRSWSDSAILDILYRESLRSAWHGRPLAYLLLETEVHSPEQARAKAEVLRRHLAPYQALGRLAPGQFLMVLPETSARDAAGLARSLLDQLGGRVGVSEPPAVNQPDELREALQSSLSEAGVVSVRSKVPRAYSFGPFELFVNEQAVPISRFRSQKVRMLLAYLLGTPDRRASEEVLLDEFWPQGGDSARKSLRAALSTLRTLLRPEGSGSDPLTRDAGFVFIPKDFPLWSDLDRFRALKSADQDEEGLKEAMQLHRGPYLDGAFEDWALRRRDQHTETFLHLATRRAQLAFARADFETGAEVAEEALRLTPERQDLLALLFRCWLRCGRPEQVARRYRECQTHLAEFGVEPSLELVELFHRAELGLS